MSLSLSALSTPGTSAPAALCQAVSFVSAPGRGTQVKKGCRAAPNTPSFRDASATIQCLLKVQRDLKEEAPGVQRMKTFQQDTAVG